MLLRSDRRYTFAAEREVVWAAMATPGAYRTWWPWLAGFEAAALATGEVWEAIVQPPAPYRLRFRVALDEVHAGELVVATVEGDVRGHARLELADAPEGCRVHLASDLGPGHRALQAIAVVARPVVVRAHDWVLDTGARQFAERALPPGRPGPAGGAGEAPA